MKLKTINLTADLFMYRIVLCIVLLFSYVTNSYAANVEMNNATLRDFVQWYTAETSEPVVIAPGLSASITVYSANVDQSNIKPFFINVLRANNLDFVNGEPSVITALSDSPRYSVPAIEPNFGKPEGHSFVREDSSTFVDQIQTSQIPTETRSYDVLNLRAGDVAPVVELFLARSATRSAATSVLPVDGANTLVVQATEDQHAALAAFLPDIDTPRDQVFIQSLMFEVSEGSAFDFSFSAGRATPRGSSDVVGGVQTSSLGDSLRSLGGSFGIFDGDALGLALTAVESDSTAEILSTPQILTMSGTQGYISVGQNVPFITGRVTGEAADVTSPFQTIERRDIGVTLTVTPTVTSSGLVIMDISSTADSISESREASDIITNQRQAQASVQLRDGETLLMGGLVSENSNVSQSGVPFLSDIPLLGRLFRSNSDSSDKSTLYIMIRATILSAR